MASSNRCSMCKKSAGTCICAGCKEYFCEKDLKNHRGVLLHELDGLLEGHKVLQDKINKTNQHNESSNSLLSRIDEWERTTIEKVTQTADEARKEIINLMESKRMRLTNQFETLFQELKELRETEDIIEQDLTRLKQMTRQLNEDLEQLGELSAIELNVEQSAQIAWKQLINVKDKSVNLEDQQHQQSSTDSETSQPKLKISTIKKEKTSTESPSHYDNKPFIFGNLNGSSIFENPTPLSGTSGSIFGSTSLKSSNNISSSLGFPSFDHRITSTTGLQFSTSALFGTTPTIKTNSTFTFGSTAGSANKPVFGTVPKFTFSDLSKQSLSNSAEPRVFPGNGSLIFDTSSDNNGGNDEDNSYEPTVRFRSIVHLLPVEVKTGEEDENVLFRERAKLYRFDSSKTLKERGIGEIKILQHKKTNLCRILMRREQVLKLCANHSITSHMELKRHKRAENAYVWGAMDFADGQAKYETLCVRFKSSDTAERFLKQFNEAKQTNTKAR